MNQDVMMMINIYATSEYDWLGDFIYDIRKLQRHHIVKREHGGENGISNYALLTPKSHEFINYLEEHDVETFNKINKMFLELNRSVCPPSKEYYEKIKSIIKKSDSKKLYKSRY